jgi:hypothetical protein
VRARERARRRAPTGPTGWRWGSTCCGWCPAWSGGPRRRRSSCSRRWPRTSPRACTTGCTPSSRSPPPTHASPGATRPGCCRCGAASSRCGSWPRAPGWPTPPAATACSSSTTWGARCRPAPRCPPWSPSTTSSPSTCPRTSTPPSGPTCTGPCPGRSARPGSCTCTASSSATAWSSGSASTRPASWWSRPGCSRCRRWCTSRRPRSCGPATACPSAGSSTRPSPTPTRTT